MTNLDDLNQARREKALADLDEARWLFSQGLLAWEICSSIGRKPDAFLATIDRLYGPSNFCPETRLDHELRAAFNAYRTEQRRQIAA